MGVFGRKFSRRRRLPGAATTFSGHSSRHGSHNPYFPKNRHSSATGARPTSLGERGSKHNDFWVYFGIIFFILASVVVVFNYIPGLKVTNISLAGNHYITSEEITAIVRSKLDEKWLFFLDKDTYFLVGSHNMRHSIESELAGSFALKNLKVTKSFPHEISITIEERIPSLVWVSNNKYFYIDPTGVVTQSIQPDQLDESFPKIFDHNNVMVDVNKQAISEALTQMVLRLRDEVPKSSNVAIDTFFILPVRCEQKQTVEKRVRLDQLEEEEIQRIQDEIRHIQELLQNNEITIDESVELLEALNRTRSYTDENNESLQVKNSEKEVSGATEKTAGDSSEDTQANSNINSSAINDNTNQAVSTGFAELKEKIIFENTYTPTPCDVATVARDVGIRTTGGWDVYFTIDETLESQMTKFLAVLKEKYPQEPRYLTYIDLRFGDKVYYQ